MRTLARTLIALGAAWITPAVQAQNNLAVVPARVDLALDFALDSSIDPSITRPAAGVELRPAYSSEQNARARRAWKRSLIAVTASQGLDVASSYGMRELNPLLASPDGRFGAKAASIKFGVTAAVVALEYVIVKKYPAAARVFHKLNWSSAALTSGIAAHNFAIR